MGTEQHEQQQGQYEQGQGYDQRTPQRHRHGRKRAKYGRVDQLAARRSGLARLPLHAGWVGAHLKRKRPVFAPPHTPAGLDQQGQPQHRGRGHLQLVLHDARALRLHLSELGLALSRRTRSTHLRLLSGQGAQAMHFRGAQRVVQGFFRVCG